MDLQNLANPCFSCGDYDGHNIDDNHALSVGFTQSSPMTLTRTGCCYQAFGTASAAFNYYLVQRYYCCGPAPLPSNVCTHTDTFIGSIGIPICYTVQCQPNAWQGQPGWVHTITFCGFSIGVGTVVSFNDPDCVAVFDCDEPPLSQCSFWVGGASYSWVSKLKPLDQISSLDRLAAPCNSALVCGSDSEGYLRCLHGSYEDSFINGPCSIFTKCDPYYSPDPEPCDRPPMGVFAQSFLGCPGAEKSACTGGVDFRSDCCSLETTWNAAFPTII